MAMNPTTPSPKKHRVGNSTIMAMCFVFVGGMVGMAYAAVPLYQLFCQVTGYNGTTQRTEQYSETILDQTMRVTFDANTSSGLNWEFKAAKGIEPRIGETVEVNFSVTNRSSEPSTGSAVFNVTPMEAGSYFNKVECFCFTETTLQPGETMEMPVVFFIDPAIVEAEETRKIKTITLSYTFYPAQASKPVAAVREKGKSGTGQL